MTHSKYAPSSAHRWLLCAGSIDAAATEQETSTFAQEGIQAHEFAEKLLRQEEIANSEIDIYEYSKVYSDYVKSFVVGDSKLYVEQRVDMFKVKEEAVFGFSDAFVDAGKELNIFDFKYGKGVLVSAYQNPQLMLYALGAVKFVDGVDRIKKITMHIVQPRINNISTYTCTIDQLLEFEKQAYIAAEKIENGDNARTPGDVQCKFCNKKNLCHNFYNYVFSKEIGNIFIKKTEDINDGDRKKLLDAKSKITQYLTNVELLVKNKLMSGEKFPGYKIGYARGKRAWSAEGEQKLLELLGDEAYQEKRAFITLTDAKRRLKWDEDTLNEYTDKPQGKEKLIKITKVNKVQNLIKVNKG